MAEMKIVGNKAPQKGKAAPKPGKGGTPDPLDQAQEDMGA